jgi:hypothetical protein
MKNIYLFIFVALLLPYSIAAQWQDKVWFFGYDYNLEPGVDRYYLNFGDSLRIDYFTQKKVFLDDTYGALCDSAGHPLVLSNGCYISDMRDSSERKFANSEPLNPGIMFNTFCMDDFNGYRNPNTMIALPDPENKDLIHFFHYPLVLEDNNFFMKNLLHTVLDLSEDNGEGRVILRNDPIVFDTIDIVDVQALKHANGRDWWIICKKHKSNRFYTTLLTPDTLITNSMTIGPLFPVERWGEMVFSPDGTQLAIYDVYNDLRLYDFDRCSGTMSNYRHIAIIDPDSIQFFAGAAWSADSRYIYVSTVKRIYQFDMQASDPASTMVLVATRNAGGCPHSPGLSPVDLSYMELAPDGRIIVTGLSTYACLHVIQHPERAGEASQVEQGVIQFEFPVANLPNYPNFRLGPLDGSSCDTLGLDNLPLANWRYDRAGGAVVDFTSVSWFEPTAWWWDFGDGSAGSTERNPTHTFPSTGAYNVCLQVSNANGSDTKCKTVWVTSTSTTQPVEDGFVVYPNPTTGQLTLSGLPYGAVYVHITDALGRTCLQQTIADGQVDLSSQPAGLYFVQVRDAQGQTYRAKPVMVQK